MRLRVGTVGGYAQNGGARLEEEPGDDAARRAQHGRFQRVALLRQSTGATRATRP